MEVTDSRAQILTLFLLVISTGLWIDLLRSGIRSRWSWAIEPRRPVPWQVFTAVLFIVIVLLSVALLMQQLFHLPPTPPHTLRHLQINNFLSQIVQMVLLALLLSLWYRCEWADFGIRKQGWKADLQFGVWGMLLALGPVFLISLPLASWRASRPHVMLQLLQETYGDPQMLVWITVAVVVMAPLIEEFLFRVLLQGALERELSPFWAIVLTACAFVTTHQEQADWAPLFPLAVILGYVYYRRRSFLSVVILHSLFNAYNLLCAVWSLRPPEVAP